MQEQANSVSVENEKSKKTSMSTIKKSRLKFYILFMLFPMAHFFFFYVYVNLSNILLAFQTFTETPTGFVGEFSAFENFAKIINVLKTDGSFMVRNSLLLFALNLVIVTPLAIIFSYYIYKKFPLSNFFKLILFLPRVVSSVVLVLLFEYIVEDVYVAIFNAPYGLLTTNGIETVLFYNLMVGFGVNILMYSGAMGGINESISESAQIDGANIISEFWHITIPQIFPTITTFLVVSISILFTDQMCLYTFFGENSTIQTVGYYLLIQSKYSNLVSPYADTLSYSEISAFGLMITALILPATLLVKSLLEKYGPSSD